MQAEDNQSRNQAFQVLPETLILHLSSQHQSVRQPRLGPEDLEQHADYMEELSALLAPLLLSHGLWWASAQVLP